VARPSDVIEFRAEDAGIVVARMDRLGASHRGWANFQPAIPEEDAPPPPTALGLLFSASIHVVPVCTWVAGRAGRHGIEPDSLGVQHATGPKVVARLASMDLLLPQGWRPVQDNPRRGLVVLTPPGTGHAEQLKWILDAGTKLSPTALTGEWRAVVYEGR
jgi:hypothetical protein